MQEGSDLEEGCLVFLWNGLAVLQDVIDVTKTQVYWKPPEPSQLAGTRA